jgi:hypothetical protein
MSRQAILKNQAKHVDAIRRYLPENYHASTWGLDVMLFGEDVAGWTLEDYVIPRLWSGMYFAEVII